MHVFREKVNITLQGNLAVIVKYAHPLPLPLSLSSKIYPRLNILWRVLTLGNKFNCHIFHIDSQNVLLSGFLTVKAAVKQ